MESATRRHSYKKSETGNAQQPAKQQITRKNRIPKSIRENQNKTTTRMMMMVAAMMMMTMKNAILWISA